MRKILIFTYVGIIMLLSLPYLLIVWLVGLFNRHTRNRMAFSFAQLFARSVLFLIGAKVIIQGQEYVPIQGSLLFAGNHKSLVDILLLLGYLPRPAAFISKISLAHFPVLSWWMRAFECLFLDRNNARRALNTILKGIENMKEGVSYIIFPEGTRNMGSNDLLPFKKGSLKLAERSKSLIVPFALRGTDEMFEQNNYQVKPGKLWLSYGEPINLELLSDEDMKNNNNYVQTKVKTLFDNTLNYE